MQHRSTRIWIASKFVRNPKCKFWTANKVTAYYQGIIFDTTLGYPGEGWSNKHPNLRMATWNTRSLTFERIQYCKSLNYDILAITELWRNQSKYQRKDNSFIAAEPKLIKKGPKKGQRRFPEDRAAGVGILLSPATQTKVESFGSEGERVCWVRLAGPMCPLFVIAVYLPHRGRVSPSQDDTLHDLEAVLRTVPQGDCICILGDFNEQLRGNVADRTGKFVGGPPSANANKLIELLQLHDLTAVNTFFAPKKNSTVHTFLATKQKGANEQLQNDRGEYVGHKVIATYKGKRIKGCVERTYGDGSQANSTQKWLVRFDDGYVGRYDRRALEKILIVEETEKIGKQLDYILVSRRRKSCVTQCRPRWEPSRHRDLHGHRNDHALLECIWKWRLRVEKSSVVKDFSPLYVQKTDKQGNHVENKTLSSFEKAVQSRLTELQYSTKDGASAMYDKFCAAVHYAVDLVLPTRTRKKGIKRSVSAKTKSLYVRRTDIQASKEEYKKVQREIKASSLQDYKDWVAEWADFMQTANGRGDVKEIYTHRRCCSEGTCRAERKVTDKSH